MEEVSKTFVRAKPADEILETSPPTANASSTQDPRLRMWLPTWR